MLKFILPLLLTTVLTGCTERYAGSRDTERGVFFTLAAPDAESVALAGNFNRWDHRGTRLSGPDRRGIWSLTLPLPSGRYEYLFVVDERDWIPDPRAPSLDDGMGGKKSVITVNPP